MKTFRIKTEDVSCLYFNKRKVIRYTIEQRHTILFFFHYWSSPMFAPPHTSLNRDELINNIKNNCSKFEIVDYVKKNS